MTPLEAFQERMEAVISRAKKQWQGKTIITFMNRKNGGQKAFSEVLRNFSNLVYFVSAFREEDSQILGLVNKIKELNGLGLDEAMRRGNDAFEEYYNFAFRSLKRMLHKYSPRQIPKGFRTTPLKDIIACNYDRFNEFLRALSGGLYTPASTDEIDKSILFSNHVGRFMYSVLEKYREFDATADSAAYRLGAFSGELENLDKRIGSYEDSNRRWNTFIAECGDLEDVEFVSNCRNHIVDNEKEIGRLEDQKKGFSERAYGCLKIIGEIIEQDDRSRYEEHLDEDFYKALRDRFFRLYDRAGTPSLVFWDEYDLYLSLICKMRRNLIFFVEYVKGRSEFMSGSSDVEALLREDRLFLIRFMGFLEDLHKEVIACGNEAAEGIANKISNP